jgi:hypothetical protein
MKKSTIKRMLELSNIRPVIKEDRMSLTNFELVKNSVDGNTYAIVKENKRYHIKQAKTKPNLTESDFDYIGGVMNKSKKSFSSYSDVTKHLNFMFEEINNHYDVDSTNLLESDMLLEKKFILKTTKKKKAKPAEEEPTDGFDFGGEGDSEGDEEFNFDDEGEEGFDSDDEDLELDSDDNIKDIQSTTGKLGQQLRDTEDISSDMMKWVAKSVLSALDLDNMDSEDKKDVIRTLKKSKEEPTEDTESEEEFDFEDMEESYDNYMEDEGDDPFDGMEKYLNNDNEVGESYDSYMSDGFNQEEFADWMDEMEAMGIVAKNQTYDSYMEDDMDKYGNPNVAEPDQVGDDMLLLDIDGINPNDLTVNRTRRGSELSTARKQANKDMSKHYHKPAAPGYSRRPSEEWASHILPNDTKFNFDFVTEDHLNREMGSYEQEKAYEDVESMVRNYGMDVQLSSKNSDGSLVYLDVVDGNKTLLVVKIDSIGNIEVGEMRGNSFIGEPLDSVEDFIDIFGEDLVNNQTKNLDMIEDIEMMPKPQKAPEKDPSQPATKPGKPDKKPGEQRPSKRPFTPPPMIDPNDPDALPGPKADSEEDLDIEFE